MLETAQIDNFLANLLKATSKITAVFVALSGIVILIGWVFDILVLKSVFPGLVTMKVNTAFAFVLIGASLWLLNTMPPETDSHRRRIGNACAFIVGLLGLLTLVEYLFHCNLGLDQFLFQESAGAVKTSHLGRMAPNTALNFFLIGLSLLLLDVKPGQRHRSSQILILIEGFISLLAFTGYVYGAKSFYGIFSYTPMALHTSLLFIIVCLGILFARPRYGLMVIFSSDTTGGILLRRLLPATIGIIFVFGLLRMAGQKAGLYDAAFGASLYFVFNTVVFLILILPVARSLHLMDVEHIRIEDKIKKLNENLQYKNQELEAFSYSVSHDLRAPLRAIDGFSRILLEDYLDRLNVEGKRLLDVIRDNTRKMNQLIDDLLSFSRVSRQGIVSSHFNMEELVKSVFAELAPLAAERDVRLEIKPLPTAEGDPQMFRQVLVNLLSNSIKFTGHKKSAIIEVGEKEEEKENVYYIKDNGAGFDQQYADKLFGIFQRLHRQDEFAGTGVGLAIVQRIIHKHGGRIWAEGRVNEGAIFYFTLPKKEH